MFNRRDHEVAFVLTFDAFGGGSKAMTSRYFSKFYRTPSIHSAKLPAPLQRIKQLYGVNRSEIIWLERETDITNLKLTAQMTPMRLISRRISECVIAEIMT